MNTIYPNIPMRPAPPMSVPSSAVTTSGLRLVLDDERREPMGLTALDTCPSCHGPILRTDASGLCWSCMPTEHVAA
jgi:hypothetical protein